jgi:hypothetical protein
MNFENCYNEWTKLRDWEFGPTIHVPEQDIASFEQLSRQLATSEALTPSTEDEHLMYAPSPWHAAYALAMLQHSSIENLTHLLFRGQKRSSWPLIPSLDRFDNPDDVNRAIVKMSIFCDLLRNAGTDTTCLSPGPGESFDLRLPAQAHMPVAQHYGLSTPLLDFTTDPAVAVYFASRDNISLDGEYSSVYVYHFPFPESEEHLLNLRLPPPFIERPYLQKGIYLESTIPGDISHQIPWKLEVRFPVQAGNDRFAIIRQDVLHLLPELQEIDLLALYAEDGVIEFIFENQRNPCTAKLIQQFSAKYARKRQSELTSLFKKIAPMEHYLPQYVDRVEDMLYWLCYCPREDGLVFNERSQKVIVRSNPEVFRMMLGVYRRIVNSPKDATGLDENEIETKKNLIKAFETALRESGFDPMSKPDMSQWKANSQD